jgi:predicted transcriptional regulator
MGMFSLAGDKEVEELRVAAEPLRGWATQIEAVTGSEIREEIAQLRSRLSSFLHHDKYSGDITVQKLMEEFPPLGDEAIRKHLRKMEAAGLIDTQPGKTRRYDPTGEEIGIIRAYIEEHREK